MSCHLAHHQQALDRNESNELTKELRETKKTIQATSGVKKTKRPGEKEKVRLPDEEEMAGSKNNAPKDPLLAEG